MNYEQRKPLLSRIEALRPGRVLICFFNFDRESIPPGLPGLSSQFGADPKESLFRVLKESTTEQRGIDLCVYTRGGNANAVWPIVSLIREFDPDFEVLVPFRCHSSGTLVALGARRIVMGPLSELSPIDPNTGNQFNPPDPANPAARLGISVEDVRAYREFVLSQLKDEDGPSAEKLGPFTALFDRLTSQVHPLAVGNVHRVLQQIKQLAGNLLALNAVDGRDTAEVVDALTTKFYSHVHMINRHEALEILGNQVVFAPPELAEALDELLRAYEDTFELRKPFVLSGFLGDDAEKQAQFVGAVIESRHRSYLFRTNVRVSQHTKLPPNVQVQLPPGQRMPLLPGLPREFNIEPTSQAWLHNLHPTGVTV
jgi:hypothetical protein